MKSRSSNIFLVIFAIIMIIIWGCSPILVRLLVDFLNDFPGQYILQSNADKYYTAIGALFTTLAFAGTITAIFIQQNNLIKQTSYDVVKNVLYKVQEKNIIDANDFIVNMLPNKIIDLRVKFPKIGSREIKENLPNEYEKILEYCRMMEYIGIVAKNKYVDEKVLIQYLGKNIIESYNALYPIFCIDNKRLQEYATFNFIHFRYLYHVSVKNKEKYMERSSKLIEKFKKTEEKRISQMDCVGINFNDIVVYDYNASDDNEFDDKNIDNCFCDGCDSCDGG